MVCVCMGSNSLKFLDDFENLKYHKIASAMIVDKSLLEEVAQRNTLLFQLECHQQKI